MNDVKISFCLPVYNVRNYLELCIQSIGNQILMGGGTIEVLCLDDCSTDGSYELLQTLKNNYPALKVSRNNHNSGVSFTRNQLIKSAKGKYIWFVDPDDLLYPGVVSLALREIEEREADVLLGNYIRIQEHENITFSPLEHLHVSYSPQIDLPVDDNGIQMCTVCAGLFKRDFLLEHQLFFNEKMIAQEDTLFYFEFGLRTANIYKFQEPCYIYRQRSTSIMHTRDSLRAQRYYDSMREMYRVYMYHFKSNDYKEKDVLLDKLNHMKQNLVLSLAGIENSKEVYNQLMKLKKDGLYPYKLTKKYISPLLPLYRKLLYYFLPIELVFWVLHILYKIRYKTNRL